MRFTVENNVFKKLEGVCFYVLSAYGIDNNLKTAGKEIETLLKENIKKANEKLIGKNIKEIPEILCYRNAFEKLGVNPNKYMCSIEALLKRVLKNTEINSINLAVDLINALSIKYFLPMGLHDIDTFTDESLCIRFSKEDDIFIPFGFSEKDKEHIEKPDKDELLYVSSNIVRTRRWIWRQSEIGKITKNTKNIFLPIDAFYSVNEETAKKAQEELVTLLKTFFNCDIRTGFLDEKNPVFIL